MSVSSERKAARAFVLKEAAAWIEDQTGEGSTETLLDEGGEYDPLKVSEALTLAKRLRLQAEKLEQDI